MLPGTSSPFRGGGQVEAGGESMDPELRQLEAIAVHSAPDR